MPVIASNYKAPKWLLGRHFETIIPSFFRKVEGVSYQRERITTPDDDFLDLDWSVKGNNRIALISHGMVGNSSRPYVLGMVKHLNEQSKESAWDTVSWNCRSCSEDANLQKHFFHAGSFEDIATIVQKILQTGRYKEIALIGFSYGGNMLLSYLLNTPHLPKEITKSICFSSPLDLHCALDLRVEGMNKIYTAHFLKKWQKIVERKAQLHPDLTAGIDWNEIKTLTAFDERFTAPLHGFSSAKEYYQKCSLHTRLNEIKTPTLIVNAKNDPFISPSCYPISLCEKSSCVFLEIPKQGGHAGFMQDRLHGTYFSEIRALQFLNS